MPTVRQPATAQRDRAERHVFGVLPELPAVERRVLAMLDLCGEDRAAVARDLGIDTEAVRQAAAVARKALRRTRAPLASGARCERAEILHSDRGDVGLDRHERRWLEIHMARCPRCIEHAEQLALALTELRAGFAAEPRQLPAAPEPPALEPGRAHLRVVPPTPATALEPTPATALEPAVPPVAAPKPKPARAPRKPMSRPQVSPAARRAARVLAILLAIAALLAGIGYGLSQIGGSDARPQAPWAQPQSPNVHPAPLSAQ